MSSSLLMDEPPLIVQPSLAVLVGLNEAMILQQVHYWLNPRINKNAHEGRLWVHNTYEQWQKQFPFWGEKTIRRTIGNLEQLRVLDSRVQSLHFKKTKFYTIDYAVLASLKAAETLGLDPSGQNDQMDLPKRAEGHGQNDPIHGDKMTRSYNKDTETTSETSLPPQGPSWGVGHEEEEEEEAYVAIWNGVVQGRLCEGQVTLTPRRAQMIQELLKGSAIRDQKTWRSYCQKIASCKFLMGENDSGFRVRFDWALDPENVAKVLEGAIYDKPGAVSLPKVRDWAAFKADLEASIACPQWRAVCLSFAEQTSPAIYDAWLADVGWVAWEGSRVILKAASRFIADTLQTHYQKALLQAIRVAYPPVQSIQFRFGGP